MTPDRLLETVRATVEELGFELVDLRQSGPPSRPVLKIRADRVASRPGAGITTGDCAALSRTLERRLEDLGAVGPQYVLEVSSPGIERPIRFPDHWRRYVGRQARVRAPGLPGHPTVRIGPVNEDDTVELVLPAGEHVRLRIAEIREATLVYEWPAAVKKP